MYGRTRLGLEQDITMEFHDYCVTLYINNEKINTITGNESSALAAMKTRQTGMYPAISWHGKGALVQMVSVHSSKP